MNKTRFGVNLLSALAAFTFTSAPSFAQAVPPAFGSGTENLAACDGGTATYVRARGDAAKHTLTKYVATLVNAGEQEVGAQQLFSYSRMPTGFSNYFLNFLDDGVTRNNVKVHFCFVNSAGEVTGVNKKLGKAFSLSTGSDGWTFANITSSSFDFGSQPNGQTLTKVTLSLSDQGNITIGSTGSTFTTNFTPDHNKPPIETAGTAYVTNLNMNNTDCSVLDNCKNVK